MKNIKRKNIYWITGVAFGLIVVMLLSFLFQQLGAPISTYAKEQNVPVPCGTFLDMRSKAKEEIYGITLSDEDKIEAEKKLENDLKNILEKELDNEQENTFEFPDEFKVLGASKKYLALKASKEYEAWKISRTSEDYEALKSSQEYGELKASAEYKYLKESREDSALYDKRQEAFFDWDHQQNEDNFYHIEGQKIAELTDPRYGISLGEESQIITAKRNENGGINVKVSDKPALTVLTYGQGGELSHWSNGGQGRYYTFVYDEDSMIEKLRDVSHADVYIATTNAIKAYNQASYNFEILLNANKKSELLLNKLECNDKVTGDFYDNKSVSNIQDYTKHNIIIFDSNASEQYHNFVYNELDIILTQLSYDCLLQTGQVPKLNMISHSTGGVWNMMWANSHPLNVDSLAAIAAPFNGTALGHYLYSNWDDMKNTAFAEDLKKLHSSVACPSGIDNLDEERYHKLQENWEEAIKINPNLYCHAFTGLSGLDLLLQEVFNFNWPEWIVTLINEISAIFYELVTIGTIVLAVHFPGVLAGATMFVSFMVIIVDVLYCFSPTIQTYVDAYGEVVLYILDSLVVSPDGTLSLKDDCTVDYNSALGLSTKIHGLSGHRSYGNFFRYEKVFRLDNCNIDKKIIPAQAAPHNLEVQDSHIIADVVNCLDCAAPQTRYEYKTLPDETAEITKIKEGYYGEVYIPEQIGGRKVTQIGANAAAGVSDITYLKLNSGIKSIGDSAFASASNLANVELNKGLVEIGDSAFQSTGLQSVDIPRSVYRIGAHAFEGNGNLGTVTFGGTEGKISFENDVRTIKYSGYNTSLRDVGEDAFQGAKFLNDEDTLICDGVLVQLSSKVTELVLDKESEIKYFAEKCFNGSNVTELDLSEFRFASNTVPEYFLYGAKNLMNVDLPEGVIIIGNSAVENAERLTSVKLPSLIQVIGSQAFAGCTALEEIFVDTGYVPSISSDAFKGVLENTDKKLLIKVRYYTKETFEVYWEFEGVDYSIVVPENRLTFYDGTDEDDIVADVANVGYYSYLQRYDWMNNFEKNKCGYSFLGWADKEGNVYVENSVLELGLDDREWKLYAQWSLIEYNVIYEEFGGNSNNVKTITVEDVYVLDPAEKVGYDFKYWADKEGREVTELKNISETTILFAKYEPKTVFVQFAHEDFNVKTELLEVAYDSRFYTEPPQREGYAFAGWYTDEGDGGVRITGTNGVSIRASKFLNDVTLYAHWTTKSFVLEFVNGGNVVTLGKDGLTEGAGSVVLGQRIDLTNDAIVNYFKKDGYIFDRFEGQDGETVDFSDGVPDLGKNFGSYIITPVYDAEEYTVNLYDETGKRYMTCKIVYDGEYKFNGIEKAGYELVGWADRNGEPRLEGSEGVVLEDFTPGTEGNGSVDLYAVWTPLKGNLIFNSKGGSKVELSDDYKAVFNEVLDQINVPQRNGYIFKGFYDEAGIQYVNAYGHGIRAWDKTENFVTLNAAWEKEIYTLTLKYLINQDARMEEEKQYSFDAENILYLSNYGTPLTKIGYTFVGWFTSVVGGEQVVTTANIFNDVALYAHWKENKFALKDSTNLTINLNNAYVNLNLLNSCQSKYHIINIDKNVKTIQFCGSTVKNISIHAFADVTICLNNVKFTGDSSNPGISCSNGKLTLVVVGTNKITGGNGEGGDNGGNGALGLGHGYPINGKTYADNGKNGGDGKTGCNGKDAIEVSRELSIKGSKTSSLTLTGGNGGNGGNGGKGGDGAYGKDGIQGGKGDDGVCGGNGGNGGRGGNGGNGGVAVKCGSIEYSTVKLSLFGGNGGNGGRGGNGGNGGDGGKGANEKVLSNNAGSGGDGGNGGDGGKKGNAGEGGNAIECNYHSLNEDVCHKGEKGSNNNIKSGEAGEGGIGGKKGSGFFTSKREDDGTPGQPGKNGDQ